MKVLSAIGHPTQHRLFAIMEADDCQDVNDLVRPEMWNGPVEVLPCNDMVATRKRNGDTGGSKPANPLGRMRVGC